MKKALFLLSASLSLLSTTQAEMIEGNVTLQLKFTRQVIVQETTTSATSKLVTATYKNADFIQHMSAVKGGAAFSKSAKIIFRISNDGESYLIRDKSAANDYDVTNYLKLKVEEGYMISGQKITFEEGNYSTTKMGTEKHVGIGSLNIATANPPEDKNITLFGPLNYTVRNIRSKLNTARTFGVPTIGFSGHGYFIFPIAGDDPDKGLVQGTMKVSGAKVLPSQNQ